MATSTELSGFDDVNNPTLSQNLKANLINFFDWGFLSKGGFFNINIPQSGLYGEDWSNLRPVNTPYFTDGRVWEGKRKNWIWEQGTQVGEPTHISGVFVDNVFIPVSGNTFHIDYPDGRIIFDTPISVNSNVELEYSFKWVNMLDAEEVPFFNRSQTESFRVEDSQFIVGSGENIPFSRNRVQMPTIAVEIASDNQKMYELGHFTKYMNMDVVFYVIAETSADAKKITDILSYQNERTIHMFDLKKIGDANKFPLDYRGEILNSGSIYPNLVAPTGDGGYRWTDGIQNGTMMFKDTTAQNGNWLSKNLYQTAVRTTIEVIKF
jgi:hypothetical protein